MMKQISLNQLVEFNKMSEKKKKQFVTTIINGDMKSKSEDQGGNYWVTCISAMKAYFRDGNKRSYLEKISNLEEKMQNTEITQVKKQFQSNINVMRSYANVDFSKWKPASISTVIKNQTHNYIILLDGFEIKAAQWLVFAFKENDKSKIGGIWFIARRDGYNKFELGMFTEILYRVLIKEYAKSYTVEPKMCVAIDVIKGNEVSYEQLVTGGVSTMLITTLNNIKRILSTLSES